MKLLKWVLIGVMTFICIPSFANKLNYYVDTFTKYNSTKALDLCKGGDVGVHICSSNLEHCHLAVLLRGNRHSYYHQYSNEKFDTPYNSNKGEVCISDGKPYHGSDRSMCASTDDLSGPIRVTILIHKYYVVNDWDKCRYGITVTQAGSGHTSYIYHKDLDIEPDWQ